MSNEIGTNLPLLSRYPKCPYLALRLIRIQLKNEWSLCPCDMSSEVPEPIRTTLCGQLVQRVKESNCHFKEITRAVP